MMTDRRLDRCLNCGEERGATPVRAIPVSDREQKRGWDGGGEGVCVVVAGRKRKEEGRRLIVPW